jgi:hypothetical protein
MHTTLQVVVRENNKLGTRIASDRGVETELKSVKTLQGQILGPVLLNRKKCVLFNGSR